MTTPPNNDVTTKKWRHWLTDSCEQHVVKEESDEDNDDDQLFRLPPISHISFHLHGNYQCILELTRTLYKLAKSLMYSILNSVLKNGKRFKLVPNHATHHTMLHILFVNW